MAKRILVVHDDQLFVDRLKAEIAKIAPDFEVFTALSGPRALALSASASPLAILIDANLPGVDGFQLTSQMRNTPGITDIPVIILAQEPLESAAQQAREAGAAAYMSTRGPIAAITDRVGTLIGGWTEAEMVAEEGPATLDDADPSKGMPAMAPCPESGLSANVPHLDELLRLMVDRGGSDLHITVGSPPCIRQRGEIIPVESVPALQARDTRTMIYALLSEDQRHKFETELELDFAYSIPGLSRFRANVFQQRNALGAVFRVIPISIPSVEQLNLPPVCIELAEKPRGLVLVTGPTGSGKSTTLAAMIDHINSNDAVHIITMEDPIEFMHKNKRAIVNQREVGEDTMSFASALKRVLRQDPDVILVGELRDLETISAAITAAETGHLVFATLHTTGGPETVDRIIDVFPPHQQQQVRMQLSSTLEGVLSQVLIPTVDGKGRIMAMEIMLGIPAIANLIREGKTHQMESIVQSGGQYGMQSLDQALRALVSSGKISVDSAISKAKNPRELAAHLGRK